MARSKFVEIVTLVELFFLYKKGIIEVVNPNIPSRKMSLRKNVNRKGKTFFVPNLQYCPFKQGGWKNKNKLKIS